MKTLKIIIDNYAGSADDRRDLYALKGIASDIALLNRGYSYNALMDGVEILFYDYGKHTTLINWIKEEVRDIGLRVDFYEVIS